MVRGVGAWVVGEKGGRIWGRPDVMMRHIQRIFSHKEITNEALETMCESHHVLDTLLTQNNIL